MQRHSVRQSIAQTRTGIQKLEGSPWRDRTPADAGDSGERNGDNGASWLIARRLSKQSALTERSRRIRHEHPSTRRVQALQCLMIARTVGDKQEPKIRMDDGGHFLNCGSPPQVFFPFFLFSFLDLLFWVLPLFSNVSSLCFDKLLIGTMEKPCTGNASCERW